MWVFLGVKVVGQISSSPTPWHVCCSLVENGKWGTFELKSLYKYRWRKNCISLRTDRQFISSLPRGFLNGTEVKTSAPETIIFFTSSVNIGELYMCERQTNQYLVFVSSVFLMEYISIQMHRSQNQYKYHAYFSTEHAMRFEWIPPSWSRNDAGFSVQP